MTLDKIVRGIESRLAEQSAILHLANAWMDRTNGVVRERFTISAQEYITQLQNVPLWHEVKEDIPLYTHLIGSTYLTGVSREEAEVTLCLRHFPTAIHALSHFLKHPEYSTNSQYHTFGSPLTLTQVLRDYSTTLSEEGGFKPRAGDCNTFFFALKKRNFREDRIVQLLGLTKEWDEYRHSKGIPKYIRKAVHATVETFLQNPDYCNDAHNKFGSPKKLLFVLRKAEVEGCTAAVHALRYGYTSEESLLEAVDLKREWTTYQRTKGIPKGYRETADQVLRHFLADPDYNADGRKNTASQDDKSFGAPFSLLRVLLNYRIDNNGRASWQKFKGDAGDVANSMRKKRFTSEKLLESICLSEAWSVYQAARGIPKRYREAATEVVTHFLQCPLYTRGKGKGNYTGQPWKLRSILRDYHPDAQDLKRKGPAYMVWAAVSTGKISEEQLLDTIGLTEPWQDYQHSTAAAPFLFMPERYQQ